MQHESSPLVDWWSYISFDSFTVELFCFIGRSCDSLMCVRGGMTRIVPSRFLNFTSPQQNYCSKPFQQLCQILQHLPSTGFSMFSSTWQMWTKYWHQLATSSFRKGEMMVWCFVKVIWGGASNCCLINQRGNINIYIYSNLTKFQHKILREFF